jgi:hypothetical protein
MTLYDKFILISLNINIPHDDLDCTGIKIRSALNF